MRILPITHNPAPRTNTLNRPAFAGAPVYEPDVYLYYVRPETRMLEKGDVFVNRAGNEVLYPDHYDEWVERFLLDYWV